MLPQPPLWLILIAFIFALGPLVFIHELGHYLVARWFKIRAEVFSIGFGREMFGWTDKVGTAVEDRLAAARRLRQIRRRHEPGERPVGRKRCRPRRPRRTPFSSSRCGSGSWSCLAGPVANFLTAILIFAAFFMILGAPQTNVVGEVQPDGAAAAAGLQPGDRIVVVANRSTATFDDISFGGHDPARPKR